MPNDTIPQNVLGQTPEVFLPRITHPSLNHIVYAVPDERNAPAFRQGEYVIVDPDDRKAMHDSNVLVEWSGGRRSLMSTRIGAGEWLEHGVRLCDDGPDEVWWFDPIVRPKSSAELDDWRRAGRIMSTSEGPLHAEHLEEMTVGRVLGIAARADAIRWAQEQCEKYDREIDERARKAAEEFDPELYIQLFDQTGKIYAVYDSPRGAMIGAAIADGCAHEERLRIYRDHAAVFAAARDGLEHSNKKLEAALRKAGRVFSWTAQGGSADPRMPMHVRDACISKADLLGGVDA